MLVNELFSSGENKVSLKFPVLGEIFKIEFGKESKVKCLGKRDYKEKHKELSQKLDESVMKEVPDYFDYRMTLQSSGVLLPSNYEAIINTMRAETDRDLLIGERPLYVGFDSNLLRHRFPSIIGNLNCGLCMNIAVKDELHPRWDRKISKEDSSLMRSQLGNGFNKIFNQPPLDARKHKIGIVEYRKVLQRPYAEEIPGMRGDLNIIKSYAKFSKKRNVDLILFTEDRNFAETARDYRLKAFQVIQRREFPREIKTSWERAVDLIYVSSIIFGFLKLNDFDVRGIWLGKRGEDWNSESLKVDIENKKLLAELERDFNILG